MPKLLHIASKAPNWYVWTEPFMAALAAFGDLEVVEDGRALSSDEHLARIRACDVLLTSWDAAPVPAGLAAAPGRLRYVCHVTGGMRGTIPLEIVESPIAVTNWGDAPATGVAEGAMALLLAAVKDIRAQADEAARGGWALDFTRHGGWLEEMSVGVYGCGAIGRRFIELLRPFGSTIRVYDPFVADLPAGCLRAESLEDLFRESQAVVIHAGLCDGTRHSVRAEHLARLPDHGVLVNTARGAIFEPEALLAELASGRLRAGLDVTEPEPLPPGHPFRTLPNVTLSCHRIEHEWPTDGRPPAALTRMQKVCLENLRRFTLGEPLLWRMDPRRYDLST